MPSCTSCKRTPLLVVASTAAATAAAAKAVADAFVAECCEDDILLGTEFGIMHGRGMNGGKAGNAGGYDGYPDCMYDVPNVVGPEANSAGAGG